MRARTGELFLLGFRGTSLPAWLSEFEKEFGLGGVCLFDRDLTSRSPLRNVESPVQLRELCREIHDLPSRPLVFVDQEGGLVRRLKPARGFCELPSHKDLAALDPREARSIVETSFAEMKSLGIDFDLAPVIDLDFNPDNPNIGAIGRSFSVEPAEVGRCAVLMADVARRVGLGLCVKHYPGLGGAVTDSHLDRTDLGDTLSDVQIDLFVELCREVPGEAMLLSHGYVDKWDRDWPVSMSAPAIAALREKLPDALLITDDVQMNGLRHQLPLVDAASRALLAGIDLVCVGNNLVVEDDRCAVAAAHLASLAGGDAATAGLVAAAQARVAARKAWLS